MKQSSYPQLVREDIQIRHVFISNTVAAFPSSESNIDFKQNLLENHAHTIPW